ncbi:MAG TPA: hypothetical protein G4N97_08550 [Thermoflexia bacterium]|nr:hypothetical protein [Thermoflexia bacterium]
MHGRVGAWLLRGLIVLTLAAAVALWVLVRPLPEPPLPTLTPTLTPTPMLTSTPTLTPTPTPTPTLTPTPTCTETTGRVEQHTYFSQTTGDEQPYRIYLPPCYDWTDRHYPVLYLLHGWPYDEAHWDSLGADEAADAGIGAGTLPPLIIVMPGGSERLYVNTCGGDGSFEGQVINDLIPHVDETYHTWAEREGRAIGGVSRGGVWALEIGFRHPDLFAALGAHSPALSVNLAPPTYDPFYLLKEPGVAALRIYLDAGDADWARGGTQALHEALDERNIAHEFVVHSGSHENGLWAANVAEYLAFYAAGW